jgi:hypothetical protein
MTKMNFKLEGTQRDGWQNLLATIVGKNKQYFSTCYKWMDSQTLSDVLSALIIEGASNFGLFSCFSV